MSLCSTTPQRKAKSYIIDGQPKIPYTTYKNADLKSIDNDARSLMTKMNKTPPPYQTPSFFPLAKDTETIHAPTLNYDIREKKP